MNFDDDDSDDDSDFSVPSDLDDYDNPLDIPNEPEIVEVSIVFFLF